MFANDNSYIDKIFNSEINKVAASQKGNRNNQLNASSFILGKLIPISRYERKTIENALIKACEENNLIFEDRNSVLKTIASGLNAGKLQSFEMNSYLSIKKNPVYSYVDENNELLFEVERINPTKEGEKKKFFQKRYDIEHNVIYGISEGWYERIEKENQIFWRRIKQTNDKNIHPHANAKWFEQAKLVPYHLPELIREIKDKKLIYYCEGEKDTNRLRKAGLAATTNPMGAAKEMPDSFYQYFSDVDTIVILEDADMAGKKQSTLLLKQLNPYVKHLIVLQLPNLKDGEDVSDWLNNGHSIDEFNEIVNLKIKKHLEQNASPELRVVNIKEFLQLNVPPRKLLLSPWLPRQGLCMLHSERGIGKTYVALNIAYAVASGGSFLRWQASEVAKVLYIDGEMPAIVMQERLAKIMSASGSRPFDPENLKIITPDLQDLPCINLINNKEALYKYFLNIDLLILDNLSTLTSFGKENESESWMPMQEMALDLRKRGKSILFIHHSGKTGLQRGTSKKEDILDTVITLKHSKDYSPDEGARFEVHFEKNRGFYGDEAKPFEANQSLEGVWTVKALEDKTDDQIIILTKEELTCAEIGEELGFNKSTISRRQKKLREQGKL